LLQCAKEAATGYLLSEHNTKFVSGQRTSLLGYHAASSGNFLLTFWDNLSVPSSGVKTPWRWDGRLKFFQVQM